jgi:hypothetical protein
MAGLCSCRAYEAGGCLYRPSGWSTVAVACLHFFGLNERDHTYAPVTGLVPLSQFSEKPMGGQVFGGPPFNAGAFAGGCPLRLPAFTPSSDGRLFLNALRNVIGNLAGAKLDDPKFR